MLFVPPEKLFLIRRCLHFCSDFFANVRKPLDKKAKINSKFMTPQPWKQIITIGYCPIFQDVQTIRQ